MEAILSIYAALSVKIFNIPLLRGAKLNKLGGRAIITDTFSSQEPKEV